MLAGCGSEQQATMKAARPTRGERTSNVRMAPKEASRLEASLGLFLLCATVLGFTLAVNLPRTPSGPTSASVNKDAATDINADAATDINADAATEINREAVTMPTVRVWSCPGGNLSLITAAAGLRVDERSCKPLFLAHHPEQRRLS